MRRSIWLQTSVSHIIDLLVIFRLQSIGKTTENHCFRDMLSESSSCQGSLESCLPYTLTVHRVPVYSASSWASIMSLKAAFWLDPLRDVYEVSGRMQLRVRRLNSCIGFHNLYIRAASDQLPWWRTIPYHHDAWPPTSPSSLASKRLS